MSLVIHAGAREVSVDEMRSIDAPTPTHSWFPIAHRDVVNTASLQIIDAGFNVRSQRFALSKDNARMFCTMDLESKLAEGVSMAIGVRNSIDKSFPLGFCAGSRVFVCDNLAFSAELSVRRKHTRNGEVNFRVAIAQSVRRLVTFQQAESARIGQLQSHPLEDVMAESLMLRAYEQDIISSRMLPDAIAAWRKPEHAEFSPRTEWSLYNVFTGVYGNLKSANPARLADLSMRLYGLFGIQVSCDQPELSNSV